MDAAAARPSRAKRWRRRVLGATRIGLAAGVLGYFLHIVPVSELAARFQAIAPIWVVLAAGLHLAAHVLAASILGVLLRPQGLAVPVRWILAVNFAAAFYNMLMPGGTLAGGAVRWYRLGYRTQKMPEVLPALVANRVLEVTSLTGLAFAGWLVAPLPGAGVVLGAALAVLAAGLAVTYAGLFSRPLALRLVVLLRRLVASRGALRRLALRFLLATRDQATLSWRRHARLVGLSLLRQLVGACAIYALALGLGLEIGFAALVWVRSLTAVLAMLPVSFAGLGVRELSFVVLLQPYGVAPAEALMLGLLGFALALLPAALGGLLELLRLAEPRGSTVSDRRTARDAR